MKLKRVLYCVPLLLMSLVFVGVAVPFRTKQRRVQTTQELLWLCQNKGAPHCAQRVADLLGEGADPNAPSSDGNTALWVVCHTPDQASVQIARKLLAAGAEANARGSDGSTPLMQAASWWVPEAT